MYSLWFFLLLLQKVRREGSSTEPISLKLGHGITLTHPAHLAAVQFAEDVEAGTNGRVKIEVYANRQLGEERDMVEGLQIGTVDFYYCIQWTFGRFRT